MTGRLIIILTKKHRKQPSERQRKQKKSKCKFSNNPGCTNNYDEVFVLGPLNDDMMEDDMMEDDMMDDEMMDDEMMEDDMMDDLLQGGCYKRLVKLVDSCSSCITGRWHYFVIAGYWEYININYMEYLIAENV